MVATLLCGTGAPHPAPAAAGDGEPPVQREPAPRSTADLDGHYLMLGPVGGAVRIEEAWDSAFGVSLTWLAVAEQRPVAAWGIGAGGARYAERDGGRVWLEGVAGTRRLGGWLVGASAGAVVELSELQHPRAGITGAVWAFLGVTPFVRAGFVDEAGGFVEIGASLPLPAWRF